jgi:hypothetical protein
MPFNYGNTCSGYNMPINFNAQNITAIETQEIFNEWDIMPNPVNAGASLRLFIPQALSENTQLTIYTASGIKVWSSEIKAENSTDMELMIPQNWSSGLYFAELNNKKGARYVKKFVIN